MAFKLRQPSPVARTEFWMRAASTAYKIDSLLAADLDNTTQAFVAATAGTSQVIGTLQRTVASTDTTPAYATATKEPILVDELGIWETDVRSNATLLSANYEGFHCDLLDSNTIDHTAVTKMLFGIVNFVKANTASATGTAQGKICGWFGIVRSNTQ